MSIRVHPRGKRPSVLVDSLGVIHVTVPEIAADDLANRAVVKLCAKYLNVPPSWISIVSGNRSRDKVLQIVGVDSETARALMSATGEKED